MQTPRVFFLSIAVLVLAAACGDGSIPCGAVTCTGGQACVDPTHGERGICATLCGSNSSSDAGCSGTQSCERVQIVPPVPAGVDHNAQTVEACVSN